MRILAFCFTFFLFHSVNTFSQDKSVVCHGRFRWSVKTLVDSGGIEMLTMAPSDTSFDAFVKIKPDRKLGIFSKKDGRLPRLPDEKHVVRLKAYIESIKEMGDKDFHIVLKSTTSDAHMVAEVPDPQCYQLKHLPALQQRYSEARMEGERVKKLIKELKQPVLVEITGVPFWDARHWWLHGSSKTGREIHPVLEIRLIDGDR